MKQVQHDSLILAAILLLLATGIAFAFDGDTSRPSWGHFTERHDEDGDGVVTPEEFGRTDWRFQRLDRDGDGIVTSEELAAASERRPGSPADGLLHLAAGEPGAELALGDWHDFVNQLDVDADGLLSEEELIATTLRRMRGGPGGGPPSLVQGLDGDGDGTVALAEIDHLFSDADLDGDGLLTAEEMPAPPFRGQRSTRFRSPRTTGSRPDGGFGRTGGLMRQADVDGDGAVTREEWTAFLDAFDGQAIFDQLDTDGDGIVPVEERPRRPPRGFQPSEG